MAIEYQQWSDEYVDDRLSEHEFVEFDPPINIAILAKLAQGPLMMLGIITDESTLVSSHPMMERIPNTDNK